MYLHAGFFQIIVERIDQNERLVPLKTNVVNNSNIRTIKSTIGQGCAGFCT